jgi:hypothetical protein
MPNLQQALLAKKAALAERLSAPLARLAEHCALVWPEADALDRMLAAHLAEIPNCRLLYAWGLDSRVISSLVQAQGPAPAWRGTDLSERPYLKNNLPFKGIMLSSVYRSMHSGEQCVTALQAVRQGDRLLGFIAADFPIGELLLNPQLVTSQLHWQQYRGDPAVRSTLFMQQRIQSKMDDQIDLVLTNLQRLLEEHGVFHVKIHFSSGRCSLWPFENPYSYRIHVVDELTNPDIFLYYPPHPYPATATITPDQICGVLQELKELRFADETVYLRSSSLNIINGIVGLTFSCDGSHYMPVEEFLDKNLSFWLGELATTGIHAPVPPA